MTEPEADHLTEAAPPPQPEPAPSPGAAETFDFAEPAPRTRAERAALQGQVSVGAEPEPPRRGFFRKLVALAVGGVVVAVPAAAGLLVFLDPVRRAKRNKSTGAAGAEFVPVA